MADRPDELYLRLHRSLRGRPLAAVPRMRSNSVPLRPNPVTQAEMDAGSIELF